MPSLLAVLALGFVLGLRHATDADHIVAVTTIVTREPTPRRAAIIGALWGVGHSITLMLVGGVLVTFRIVLPVRLGLGLELAVALMLVGLGMSNLGRHRHPHHASPPSAGAASASGKIALRPFGVGLVHGLAGSAAISLLVLETIPSARWALVYLGVFGIGTILGMAVLTTLIALPMVLASERVMLAGQRLPRWAGIVSMAFGALLVYRIGFVDGLFAASPHVLAP